MKNKMRMIKAVFGYDMFRVLWGLLLLLLLSSPATLNLFDSPASR